MINKTKDAFIFLLILIPFFLILGPAIPDIVITTSVIFGLIWTFLKKEIIYLINFNFIKISIIFWIGLIFISFFAVYKGKSFQDSLIFLRFLLIPIFCYFLFLRDYKYLNYLLLLVFFLVIFVSLDTLYQFFNYTSKDGFGSDLLGYKSKWYGRLTGPFKDELIPGSYVSKFGLIGYAYLLLNKKLNNKIFFHSIYLSLILIVCYVSGERMAFATFFLALISLFIFLSTKRKGPLFAIIISLTVIFFINKFHPFYNDYKIIDSNEYHQGLKVEKKFVCENNLNEICTKIIDIQPKFIDVLRNFKSSTYGEIYLVAYKMFKQYPITGIGLSNFKLLCENDNYYKKMMKTINCASHPHNTYIQWATEGGVLILFLFLLYLSSLVYFIINNEGEKKFKIISIVILLIMFWPIMSTGSLVKNWYGISVFFIIGISMCLSRIKRNY